MGNLNGQDSNSLLSKRLKKVTADRPAVRMKPEQPGSVVAKIERVLFAYRETLAYYQDMLEQFETEYEKKSASQVAALQALLEQVERYQIPTQESSVEEEAEIISEAAVNEDEYAPNETARDDNTSIDAAIQGIESIKASIHALSEELGQVAVTVNTQVSDETGENEDSFLEKMEVYNRNLSEIKKRLDDLMKFVGKVDGSIIESLKAHTNENRNTILEQLDEIRRITQNQKKGLKPLVILNFILGIINAGGITFLILYLLGYISF